MIILKNEHNSQKPYRAGKFYIDEGPLFNGFKNENYWNGWECPVFIKEEAEKVLKEFMREEDEAYYDQERDAFVVRFVESDEEDTEYFEGFDIKVEDETHRVYGIGAFSWCWDEKE